MCNCTQSCKCSNGTSNSDKPLDFTKPVQTRGGGKVRILCTDRKGCGRPVVGLVLVGSEEMSVSWNTDGRCRAGKQDGFDLVQAKESKTVTIWLFRDSSDGKVYTMQKDVGETVVDNSRYEILGHKTVTVTEGDNG